MHARDQVEPAHLDALALEHELGRECRVGAGDAEEGGAHRAILSGGCGTPAPGRRYDPGVNNDREDRWPRST